MRYLLLLVAIAGLAACQKQEAQPEPRSESVRESELQPGVDEGPEPAPDTHVTWARATAEGQSEAAVYAVIHNHHGGTDQLIGADTSRARVATLQAVKPVNGAARARQVQSLELKAGHGMELKPGGNQIMLNGLSSPLKAGERFPMTLHFKRSGDQEVRVVVVPPGAGAPDEY
jgi:hypothetical protein